MKELFEIIGENGADRRCKILTVLDGECAGEKAVFADGKLIWESREKGFFTDHADENIEIKSCGQILMGTSRVFCDTAGGEERLVICGGGHVSMPVIRIGVMMGWNVTVLEDRPKYADNARRAGAQEVICGPFEESLEKIAGSENTYFVVLTRGHRYDVTCLEKIVEKRHAYIGMIGSRRRSAIVKQDLVDRGYDKRVLEEVASPIGLDIGAETPEEIGVAIIAEIIAKKHKNAHINGYPKELLQALQDEREFSELKVLATIVSRKGSAPRGVGAKMLVYPDGRTLGTIGGGCVEADILRSALLMIREDGKENQKLCQVDMLNTDAEEEGMVCGGTVEVLLEIV